MDVNQVERYIKHTMNFLYARTILELLNDVVRENCYGCEVDHPSQVHHTCLMWTNIEHLHTYLDLTFNKIDQRSIVNQLRNQVELMELPEHHKTIVHEQFEDWCKIHKPKPDDVRDTTERLLLLENRFN